VVCHFPDLKIETWGTRRYSRLYHALLIAYWGRWSGRYLSMFATFTDDSGTSREHKMAVACGILLPALQLKRFESEWHIFLHKEGIPDFHSSECLARNQHSAFANWDDERVRRTFARVRQITFKYSIKGFCIGIHKQDYDEVLQPNMKSAVGESHYTWAVSSVLGLAEDWASSRGVPMEYVFDNADKPIKREIEDAIEYSDILFPGRFAGHYSFRKRAEVPALQAVDLFAWSCFQGFRAARFNNQLKAIAAESRDAYVHAKNGDWSVIQSLTREGLEKWVNENRDNPRTQEIIAFKQKLKESKKPKAKTGG
jgi:hypothetical protein